jgi:hypothetical protein
LGEKVIGVASFDNTHVFVPVFTIDDDLDVGYITMTFSEEPPTEGTFPIAIPGLAMDKGELVSNELGNFAYSEDFTGKIALVKRGGEPFSLKAQNAKNAGAAGVAIYNNVAGLFSGTLGADLGLGIPVVGISLADGLAIKDRIEKGETTLTWTADMGSFPSPTGGLISSFSSYGLSPDLALKPDIGAPGGNIYSTYPVAKGSYATMSGTSMSSPHVAGAVALLLEAKPKTPAQAVRGILQNSADPKAWWGNPGLGFLDNVHRQGAGMLDIDDAILATTVVTPAKLSLGECLTVPHATQLAITNKSAGPVTYTLGHLPALSTGPNTFTPAFFTGFAAVSFDVPEVTVAAGTSAPVSVTITANPSLANGSMYGGYIVISGSDGSVLRVPYAGYKGDYQARQVLTPGGYGFPALAWSPDGVNFGFADAGDIFTMEAEDVPYVLVHLDHQSDTFMLEAIDAASGKNLGVVLNERYLPRNSTATGFFAFPWDGVVLRGRTTSEAPNGAYYLKVSVLKALGDKDNPEHWETWTSPMFEVARPNWEPQPPGNKPPSPPGKNK